MKKVILTMLAVAAMSATMQAKTVKTEIPVNGKCNEMCKPRIEKAAKAVPGVLSATWNLKAQKLTLVYDNTKTDTKKVQKACEIMRVGFTDHLILSPEGYYSYRDEGRI